MNFFYRAGLKSRDSRRGVGDWGETGSTVYAAVASVTMVV